MQKLCIQVLAGVLVTPLLSCTPNPAPDKEQPAVGPKKEPVAEVERMQRLRAQLIEADPAKPTWEIEAQNLTKLTVRMAFFDEGKTAKESQTVFTWAKWDKPALAVIGTSYLSIDEPNIGIPKGKEAKYSLTFKFDKAPPHERTGDKDMTLAIDWRVQLSGFESRGVETSKKNEAVFLFNKIGMPTQERLDIHKEVPVLTAERLRAWTATKGRRAMAVTMEME
jgi:hypothetical protein